MNLLTFDLLLITTSIEKYQWLYLSKINIMNFINNFNHISRREEEVLLLTAKEYTVKEIATELFISHHTAISHRKNLMSKWDVKNMAGLVRRGFELGVLKLSN